MRKKPCLKRQGFEKLGAVKSVEIGASLVFCDKSQ